MQGYAQKLIHRTSFNRHLLKPSSTKISFEASHLHRRPAGYERFWPTIWQMLIVASGLQNVILPRNEHSMLHWSTSSARLGDILGSLASSPSQKAIRHEDALQLANALEQLPDAQRETVVLRHLQGYSLNEIAAKMDRSPTATAGLLKRGLKRLREILDGMT